MEKDIDSENLQTDIIKAIPKIRISVWEQLESLPLDANWAFEKNKTYLGAREEIIYVMRHSCGGWTIPTRWPYCLTCRVEVPKGAVSVIMLKELGDRLG